MFLRFSLILLALASLIGCQSGAPSRSLRPTTARATELGLGEPRYVDVLDANAVPPEGWQPEPLKSSAKHKHQVWLSPSGHTAYGIIHFSLPLPVGHDGALWGFLREMRRSEGQADLLSKQWDENLNGMRFVAQGGLYLIRTNLFVRGFTGWACYAGTMTKQEIVPSELELAEVAREHTTFGHQPGNDQQRDGQAGN